MIGVPEGKPPAIRPASEHAAVIEGGPPGATSELVKCRPLVDGGFVMMTLPGEAESGSAGTQPDEE
jgi:hypothetical protein